ncbi:MAG: endonuclease V [Planctomycetaceae bacterium]|nr:endonuclease V [Planctomycetaceae bacterium]
MLTALDVQYTHGGDGAAHAAAVVFDSWDSQASAAEYTSVQSPVTDYEPGKFFQRELQPLLQVISKIREPVETIIIDGYCHLSTDGAPGLGAWLAESLPEPVPIVGVAKNPYRGSAHAISVRRSDSKRPLYVTAIGMDLQTAADCVAGMAGAFRIPTMLKRVDTLARESAAP